MQTLPMLTITKIFHFEAAHRITDYRGACRHLHGHSYKLEVSISVDEMGEGDMLMDFKDLKELVNESVIRPWDHALLLKDNEGNHADFDQLVGKIYWMKTEPTAERMVLWIANKLAKGLPAPVQLTGLKLYETAGSLAEWNNIRL
jgi:6-pyruvoyltetrahydropterin/6-carboxytetrahydropterin synthase